MISYSKKSDKEPYVKEVPAMLSREETMELSEILDNTPKEEVISKIQALNPSWKSKLLPWRITKEGEEIPWFAVYCLMEVSIDEEDMKWAEKKVIELGLQNGSEK